jgi:hypothetical protein
MIELERVSSPSLTPLNGEHGDTGVPGTGIDSEFHTVHVTGGRRTILQSDGEGGVAGHDRPVLGKELPRPSRVRRLQGSSVHVEHEDAGVHLTVHLLDLSVEGDAVDRR